MNATQVYVSDQRTTLTRRFQELVRVRELIWNLAWRDIKVRYKQSVLGIVWAMFVPLAMMLVFTFIFTRIVPVETDVPYAIFAYCGLLPWQFFSSSTTTAVNSLVANRSLITKIYFPAEVLPLSSIIASFVDFIFGSIFLLGLMVWFSFTGHTIAITWTAVLVIIVILVQILLATGLSLILSMGNLFFRDVRYIFNVGIMLWMFASSVVYPMKTSDPKMQVILNLNPMTPILDGYRDVLLRGKMLDWSTFSYSVVVAFVLLLTAWVIFYSLQYKYAEKV